MTSRLARVVCGVQIRNLKKVFDTQQPLDNSVWENDDCKAKDYVIYLLVRYVTPHGSCGRFRGPEGRPLCPGGYKNTHALWKWHERPATFDVGVGELVLGQDIAICSETRYRNKMNANLKR